jgi:outer membrane biosynthesis protein TonB
MLAVRGNIETCSGTMNLRRIIPTDITVSAIVHLSLLTLLLLFSEVHQFGSVTAETMAVEIVAPQDIPQEPTTEKQPEPVPTPTPLPDFSLFDNKSAPPSAAQPAAKSQPAARQQKQAALAAPPAAQPQPAAPLQPAAQQPAAPAYKQPEPDLTLKYQVMLGLPPDLSPTLPAAPQALAKSDDNFDAPATQDADVASSVVTAFRRHLRTCLKLPPSLAASDDVRVKLRVMMTQRGTLAGDPILIEASASMKGPLLMQGAVQALQACQPYAMLPADRYGEWKVLDLSFTPRDFGGAS